MIAVIICNQCLPCQCGVIQQSRCLVGLWLTPFVSLIALMYDLQNWFYTLRTDHREETLFGEVIHILPLAVNEFTLVLGRVLKPSNLMTIFAYAVQKTKEYI